eukprot:2424088-Amphidinium_carterae.2
MTEQIGPRRFLLTSEPSLDWQLLGRSFRIKHVPLDQGRAQHMGELNVFRLTKTCDFISDLRESRSCKQSASNGTRNPSKIRPMLQGNLWAFGHNMFDSVKGPAKGAHGRDRPLALMAGLTFST